jgi:hypothetical protein
MFSRYMRRKPSGMPVASLVEAVCGDAVPFRAPHVLAGVHDAQLSLDLGRPAIDSSSSAAVIGASNLVLQNA